MTVYFATPCESTTQANHMVSYRFLTCQGERNKTRKKQQAEKNVNNKIKITVKVREKIFFRQLVGSWNTTERAKIDVNEFGDYWKTIWSKSRSFNEQTEWIHNIADEYCLIPIPSIESTEEDVAKATKRSSNWKASCFDYLQNYWLKYLTATHGPLVRSF